MDLWLWDHAAMPDANTVALISVTSSAVVAVVASGTQAAIASANRRHERTLEVERRIWSDQSAMLAQVTAYVLSLKRLLVDFEGRNDPDAILPALRESRDRLDGELATTVELLGSERVRVLLNLVRHALRRLDLDDTDRWQQLRASRQEKERQFDVGDFEAAAEARARELELFKALGLDPFPRAMRGTLDDLTDALRAEVGRPKSVGALKPATLRTRLRTRLRRMHVMGNVRFRLSEGRGPGR
jgi:hypothetical protein